MWVRPEDQKKVGITLARARKRSGLSQVELADLLEKPQSFISSYESGQRRVDILEFIMIAEALCVDATKIFAEIRRLFSPPKMREKRVSR